MVKNKRSNIIPHKYFETNDAFQSFVKDEKQWMFTRVIESITYALDNKLEEANILEASIEESMSIFYMDSSMYEWNRSLNLALKWYESEEDYESCSKIVKLLDRVDSYVNDLMNGVTSI